MAFHLLQHDRAGAQLLSRALLDATNQIRHCSLCHTFTEAEVCRTCRDPQRDHSKLCVVETPADLAAMERTGAYSGYYFVLMGRISPMDGVGAKDVGLPQLVQRALDGKVQEVILATSFTTEGEATAMYLSRLIKPAGIKVTRLAHGLSVGSDIEYADEVTLLKAVEGRREL